MFYTYFLGNVLIFAILALSLDLAWGYAGILSLGHTLFFGTGAYAYAVFVEGGSLSLGIPSGVAVIVSIALVALLGFLLSLLIRLGLKSIFFGMIILTLVYIGERMTRSFQNVLGGIHGIPKIPTLTIGGFKFVDQSFFYLILLIFIVIFILLSVFLSRPIGIRSFAFNDNILRSYLLGYDVEKYQMFIYVISAIIAGLAGALYASFNGFISNSLFDIVLALTVVFWVIIGGLGSLGGVALSTIIIESLSRMYSSEFANYWKLCIAVVFVLIVVLLPEGIAGRFSALKVKVFRRIKKGNFDDNTKN
jgi:branched-chain amino acid transport system permease protein